MSDKLPEDLQKNLEKVFNDPDIVSKFKDMEGKTFVDVLVAVFQSIFSLFQDKDKLIIFFETLPELLINLDKLFIEDIQFDWKLHTQLTNLLETAYKFDKANANKIIISHIESFNTKYPFESFIYTIQLMRDFIPELARLLKSAPLDDFVDIFSEKLFGMIEKNQKEQFDYYFFDWILKFGYLIEAYYKEYLIVIYRLVMLLNGEDFENIPKKDLTVGRLLKRFESDSNLGIIRNAIFHSDFTIDYQININKREIIFKDWKGREEKFNISEFFNSFFGVFQVVNTARQSFRFFFLKMRKQQINQSFAPLIQQIKEMDPQELRKIDFNNEMIEQFKKELENVFENMADMI